MSVWCSQFCCNDPPNVQAGEETRLGGSQERRDSFVGWLKGLVRTRDLTQVAE